MQNAINALAIAITSLAEAINGQGVGAVASNVTPIKPATTVPATKPATPAAAKPATPGAKPAGNVSSLEKARAAAKAKKEAEAAAAAADAGGEDLPGGGTTLESLRAQGMQILKLKRQPQMKELLAELGAESITTLSEEMYDAAAEGLQAIIDL